MPATTDDAGRRRNRANAQRLLLVVGLACVLVSAIYFSRMRSGSADVATINGASERETDSLAPGRERPSLEVEVEARFPIEPSETAALDSHSLPPQPELSSTSEYAEYADWTATDLQRHSEQLMLQCVVSARDLGGPRLDAGEGEVIGQGEVERIPKSKDNPLNTVQVKHGEFRQIFLERERYPDLYAIYDEATWLREEAHRRRLEQK